MDADSLEWLTALASHCLEKDRRLKNDGGLFLLGTVGRRREEWLAFLRSAISFVLFFSQFQNGLVDFLGSLRITVLVIEVCEQLQFMRTAI